ncbi:MAG: hypothetical protein K6E55_10730 [Thermoguttaceae bacterium]|nr:hypothetical protein [Thermoguttaceae bacterium]
MTRYGKFEDGVFNFAPINYITPTGRTICNFNRKVRYLTEYGFLPVQSNPFPEYDYETQEVVPTYTQGEGVIIESWTVVDMEGGENAAS